MNTLRREVRSPQSAESRWRARFGLLLVCALMTAAPSALAAVRYVDSNASVPGPRDGTSWARAFSSIQAGINAATSGADEVWVANGTYVEGSADPTKWLA
ncbi:MAG: hypothetical protein HC888_19270 [Candidatus Competibacteraceae bacterium]|nr:hypothetical protein [Candidatus Competibacteraceae bacterium]